MNVILFTSAFLLAALAFAVVVMPLRGRVSAAVPKVVVPSVIAAMLGGISLYLAIGSPDAAAPETSMQASGQAPGNQTGKEKLESVDQLLAGLEERLEQQPDDGKGWLLLAKSYDHVGRKAESISAYEKARELGAEDAEFAAQISEHSQAISYPLDDRAIETANALLN